jgi:hypothetical protein
MTTEPMPQPSFPPPVAEPGPASSRATSSTSTLAVISLVCGILGWTIMPMLGSLVAVITGHLARSEIRASQGRLEGDGLALAGLVLGWASIAIGVLMVIGVLLFFGGLAAIIAASGN